MGEAPADKAALTLDILPDDVIREIFEVGYMDVQESYRSQWEPWNKDSFKFSLTVSHISSRLRALALSTPLLWTYVGNDMQPEEINASLSRSRCAGLFVFIGKVDDQGTYQVRRFVDNVSAHSKRWSKLLVEGCYAKEALVYMSKRGVKDFPMLEEVIYERCLDESHDAAALISSCNMPALSSFRGMSILPQPSICPDLKSLFFRAGQCDCTCRPLYTPLFDDLARIKAFTKLTQLSLVLCITQLPAYPPGGAKATHEFDPILLPELTSLSFSIPTLSSCLEASGTTTALWNFFTALDTPKLESLACRLGPFNDAKAMDAFVQRVGSCPKLKSLTIQHIRQVPLPLGLLLSKVPELEHLKVAFVDIFSGGDKKKVALPISLQTLSICNCDKLSEDFVQDLYGALQEAGLPFRQLRIERCTSLSSSFLFQLRNEAPRNWIVSVLPWGEGRSP